MLQLDLDDLEKNMLELNKFTELVKDKVDVQYLVDSFLEDSLNIAQLKVAFEVENRPEVDEEALELSLEAAHIIQVTQFWLKNKEAFKKLDRILDHSENLMLKVIEEHHEEM